MYSLMQNFNAPIPLKKRSDIHWARKLWHISTVFTMFVLHLLLSESTGLWILVIASILLIGLDILRIRSVSMNQFIVRYFSPLMRENELHKFAGTTYLLSGVTLSVLLFSHSVVSLSLLFLAFADPLASYIGIRYGKEKLIGQKTLQGFIAAFVVCVLCSVFFSLQWTIPLDRRVAFCLIAGLIGAAAELVPVGKIDDNFTLPLLSGVGLYGVFSFFGF